MTDGKNRPLDAFSPPKGLRPGQSLGKAADVGRQFEGVNAFEHAQPAIARLVEIKKEVELRETQQNIAPAAARKSILMLGGRVEAGTNFNVTPDFCSFTVDRRINPEENLEEEKQGGLPPTVECRDCT